MRRLAIAVLALLCAATATAQLPGAQHRCWDLPQAKAEPTIQVPYIIADADSGLMLIGMAKRYLGTRYRPAGRTPKGFDCSGFALFLYRHFGHDLPGYSGGQARLGTEVSDTRNLQAGDLVFFGGRHRTKAVGHTGIVVATDTATGIFRFIHSSTGAGVIISRSDEPYYRQRYITARRIFR